MIALIDQSISQNWVINMALQFTDAMGRKYVTVTNARTNFGALLDHLKATGETIYITKRGKAVVKIYPLVRPGDAKP